jgi:hypothetical protein
MSSDWSATKRKESPIHSAELVPAKTGLALKLLLPKEKISSQSQSRNPRYYFFLAPRRRPRPATVFLGPLHVRALVRVR